jgi:type I restriction enzyme S subunit
MSAKAFHEHSERESKGSVNPYVNYSDLSWYEFALPPIEEQASIAKAFALTQALSDSLLSAMLHLDQVVSASTLELLARPIDLGPHDLDIRNATALPGWSIATADEMLRDGMLLALQDGNHGAQYPKAEELGNEGYPYIAASDISLDGVIDLSSARRIRPKRAKGLRIPPAQSGDVILSHNATVGRVSRLPPWHEPIVASTSTTYYRCNEERLDPEYLRWFLESQIFQFQLQSVMRQSTRNQVPITMQKRLLLAWPAIDVQRNLASIRIELRSMRKQLQARRERALSMAYFL